VAALPPAPLRSPSRRYELAAQIDLDRGTVAGTMRLDYRHDGDRPIGTLVFLLAPNRLVTPPDLPVERLDARFPEGFEAPDLSVRDVRDRDGQPLAYGIDGARLTVFLPKPLAPGETTSLSLAFVTTVPVAEGLIGRLSGTLRVQGGWHPLLAAWNDEAGWRLDRLPPPARFDATLTAPVGVTIVSGGVATPGSLTDRGPRGAEELRGVVLPSGPGQEDAVKPSSVAATRFEAEGRYLPLVAGRGYRLFTADAGPVRLEAYHVWRDGRRARWALAVTAAAVRLFHERHPDPDAARVAGTEAPVEPSAPPGGGPDCPSQSATPPLRLVEAPLAAGLAAIAEDVILLDPQFGKIFPALRPFHGRQLAYRVYEALWRRHLHARGADPPQWVIEALAAMETQATADRLGRRLPRLERTARTFRFIPIVDEFLYSGRVPNRAIYQERLEVVEDPADLGRLGAPALPGWRIARKLDALVGPEAVAAGVAAYASDPGAADFAAAVSAAAGRDLAPFVAEWTGLPRAADYAIEVGPSRRVGEEGGGEYETTIRLRARPPDADPPDGLLREVPAAEAVPIGIGFRGNGGTRRVADSAMEETWTIRSERPVRVVEVDPEGVTEDRWRADNRVPRRWRYLLTRLSASLDITQGELEVRAAGRASRVYGGGPVFGASLFRDQESAGFSASVGYGLGEWPPGGRHSLGLTGSYERLDPGFGRVAATDRTITTVGLGYGFDSRFDSRHPLSGSTAGAGLTWSDTAIGSDVDYVLASVRGTTYLRVAPNQAVALRAEVGETLSGNAPFGKAFLLGGTGGLRAYPKDAFSGRSLSLGAIEYRFPIIRDLDQWVVGLLGARGVSGVVALEAGQTSSDRNPFRPRRYRAGVDVGLRLAVRILGVSPSLVAFDVAMPLDRGPDPGAVQVYVSASQTF
jgi:hypothetical protein